MPARKVQVGLQLGVSRGLRDVLLAPRRRVYQRDVVAGLSLSEGSGAEIARRLISTPKLTQNGQRQLLPRLVAPVDLRH